MSVTADVPVATLISRLQSAYPGASYELNWNTPLEMLIATILAAQCTDERVNRVTQTLFVNYPDAQAYAQADRSQLEQELKPTGFFRQKANTVQNLCQALCDDFGGEVPRTMSEMLRLPGVARKTANVVFATCFNDPTGVIVDTHVARLSKRMGLSRQRKPDRIEDDLMASVPRSEWTFFGPAMILLGRYVCKAKKPGCDGCMMADICPKIGV
ncbi:MAG: endonuclease III [Nannocystaceae bacterium]